MIQESFGRCWVVFCLLALPKLSGRDSNNGISPRQGQGFVPKVTYMTWLTIASRALVVQPTRIGRPDLVSPHRLLRDIHVELRSAGQQQRTSEGHRPGSFGCSLHDLLAEHQFFQGFSSEFGDFGIFCGNARAIKL